ncbi:hypothetical protein NC661_10825 [Aquibacillus koreensis]|uniref:Uncharacterized protein n=1 Tax=Aquibacillus koreensis TaxID=279446 RepID=A0A9X4AJZ5_9BACI|nr:hypothetical protein [Aquibacillus koreensis]MCT2538193.1 hypothetical protein [Aquibacillus koreensis]MDC3420863.1 hypothetical protein [Aquibacillus koreensis]
MLGIIIFLFLVVLAILLKINRVQALQVISLKGFMQGNVDPKGSVKAHDDVIDGPGDNIIGDGDE